MTRRMIRSLLLGTALGLCAFPALARENYALLIEASDETYAALLQHMGRG